MKTLKDLNRTEKSMFTKIKKALALDPDAKLTDKQDEFYEKFEYLFEDSDSEQNDRLAFIKQYAHDSNEAKISFGGFRFTAGKTYTLECKFTSSPKEVRGTTIRLMDFIIDGNSRALWVVCEEPEVTEKVLTTLSDLKEFTFECSDANFDELGRFSWSKTVLDGIGQSAKVE